MSRTFEQVFKSQLNGKRHKTELNPSFQVQGVKVVNASNLTFGQEGNHREDDGVSLLQDVFHRQSLPNNIQLQSQQYFPTTKPLSHRSNEDLVLVMDTQQAMSPPRMFSANVFSPLSQTTQERKISSQAAEKKPQKLVSNGEGLLTPVQRHLARNVFNEWIKIQKQRKEKWVQQVKFSYHVQRRRLSKILREWKIQIRLIKILRLKRTLVSHNHYRATVRLIVQALKDHCKTQKRLVNGLDIFVRLEQSNKQKWYGYFFDKTVKLSEASQENERKLLSNHEKWLKRKSIIQLSRYKQDQEKKEHDIKRASQFRTKFLSHRVVVGLKVFTKMKNKKLESMRVVQQHLLSKRRAQVLDVLRNQLNHKIVKADNTRKACKFRLFRYTMLLKQNALAALRSYATNLKNASLKQRNQRKVFAMLKSAVHFSKQHQLSKQRYWGMWKKQIRNQNTDEFKDDKMQNQICVRLSQEVRRSNEFGIKKELNQMYAIPKMQNLRVKLITKALQRPLHRLYRSVIVTIDSSEQPKSFDHQRGQLLKNQTFKALKKYSEKQQKKMLNFALARKYSYMHMLLRFLRFLQSNASYSKRMRELKEVAKVKSRQVVLKTGLNVLYRNKMLGDEHEDRLYQHLLHVANETKFKVLQAMRNFSDAKYQKRIKHGLAIRSNERQILKSFFKLFKSVMCIKVKRSKDQQLRLNRALRILQKHKKQKVLNQLFRIVVLKRAEKCKVGQVVAQNKRRLLSEYLLMWRIQFLARRQDQVHNDKSDLLYCDCLSKKVFKALRIFRDKKIELEEQNGAALRLYQSKNFKLAFGSIRRFFERRKEKKMMFQNALGLHQKRHLQKLLFRLLKVAAYWTKDEPQLRTELRQAFTKWKKLSPTITKTQVVKVVKKDKIEKPDVLQWLEQFDKGKSSLGPVCNSVPGAKQLNDFDKFISSIKKPEAIPKVEVLPTPQNLHKEIFSQQQQSIQWSEIVQGATKIAKHQPIVQTRELNLSLSSFGSAIRPNEIAITRADYLKTQISKFLQDKKHLSTLQDSKEGEIQAYRLRLEILDRSAQIQAYCAELKQIKSQQ